MIFLKILAKILKVLKEGATPGQIAGGFALGFALGLVPGWPIQAWLVLLLLLIFSANITMGIAGLVAAISLGWIFDPVLDALGGWVLNMGFLQGIWTGMYNSPPWALTRFNNTVVMGSFLAALILCPPLYYFGAKGVISYREKFLERFKRFRIVQAIMGSKFYGFFMKLAQLGLS